MKCHYVWFNSLLLLHLLPRLVSGLRITIQPGPNGVTTVDDRVNVEWNHEPNDPPGFDFRFVIDAEDVGLARANIVASAGESGSITLRFPQPGHYVIMAVSGPQNTVIGASNEVEVLAAAPTPTTPATTTQTVTSTVTVTATSSKVNAESSSSASPKAAVVAGIVIGVILLVALIVCVVFYFFRKRKLSQEQSQRLSFHPEQMVRRRSRFLSFRRFTLRGSRGSTAPDFNAAEQGVSTVTPFPAPPPLPPMVARSPSHVSIVITSPTSDRAPQLQFKNPFETPAEAAQRSAALRPLPQPPKSAPAGGIRPLPTAPASVVPTREQLNTPPPLTAHLDNLHHRALPTVPRTERQRRLGARLSQVREQLEHLEGSQEQLGRVLEDLRKQEKWLTIQYDSDWALGLTDVLPPGYARYMTP